MANPSLYSLTLYIVLHISWHAAFFSINFIFLQTVYIYKSPPPFQVSGIES